jgi:hypothetical protein
MNNLVSYINGAIFSPCRNYRYALWRWWDADKPFLMVVGLNPSTADETNDDPTIRRCKRFAADWGYGGLCMVNLFAIRSKDRKIILSHPEPVGIDNDETLKNVSANAGMILAAWGADGAHMGRDKWMGQLLGRYRIIWCLGKTKDGHPRHPLYIKADTIPVRI